MVAFLTEEGERVTEAMYDSTRRAQDRLLAPLRPELRSALLTMASELIEGNNRYSATEASTGSAQEPLPALRQKRKQRKPNPARLTPMRLSTREQARLDHGPDQRKTAQRSAGWSGSRVTGDRGLKVGSECRG